MASELEQLEFPSDGYSIRAVLARPASRNGRDAPAVIVMHEWWGLTEHTKELLRRMAAAGFVALAPNLYSRQGYTVTQDPQEAAKLMNALESQTTLRDLNQTMQYLKARPEVDPLGIGVVGFSMGGTFAMLMAAHNSDVKACVPFYGKVPPIETINYFLCPIQYHHAVKDECVTGKEVATLRTGLEKYGKPGEVYAYPEADHGFFNAARPEAYREGDAKLALPSRIGPSYRVGAGPGATRRPRSRRSARHRAPGRTRGCGQPPA